MLIGRDQVIVGRPAVEVREILRTLNDVPHSTRALAERLGLDEAAARSLVSDLRAEDLIEMCDRSGPYVVTANEDATGPFPEMWSTTIGGAALAKARIGVPMRRVTAQGLLDGVLARVIEVNRSDEWLHWVIEVVLYGSFALDGDGPVGDIDVAVRLEAPQPPAEYCVSKRR
jgi:hypothetical protein